MKPTRFIMLCLAGVLLIAAAMTVFSGCPDEFVPEECGPNQVAIAGECVCEQGYHWDEPREKCVLDTTSHNFVFVLDTVIGDPLTSQCYEAAIINANDIWVGCRIDTGMIMIDSVSGGPVYFYFNAAHWDGDHWEFQTLVLKGQGRNDGEIFTYFTSIGKDIDNVYHIGNETWFVNGAALFTRLIDGEWDYFIDQVYQPYYYGVNAIWGKSPLSIVLVGSSGNISTYNGSGFFHTNISSRTEIPFWDVWGVSEDLYWIVGFHYQYKHSDIYKYDGTGWEEIYYQNWSDFDYTDMDQDTLAGAITTVWAYKDTLYLGGFLGLWKESISTGKGYWITYADWGVETFYIVKVRGNAYNDVFVLGFFGQVLHFNGKTWKQIHAANNNHITRSFSVKDNTMVMVGLDNNVRGIIIRGIR